MDAVSETISTKLLFYCIMDFYSDPIIVAVIHHCEGCVAVLQSAACEPACAQMHAHAEVEAEHCCRLAVQ
jgi:hypothetical protein